VHSNCENFLKKNPGKKCHFLAVLLLKLYYHKRCHFSEALSLPKKHTKHRAAKGQAPAVL
jgi:hypothetical protein